MNTQNLLFPLFAIIVAVSAEAQNTFPASGNVGIGTTSPGAKLSFTNVDNTNLNDGITWYSPAPLDYGIYRTAGGWASPNYQQLKVHFETGIILNPGSLHARSFVDIQGGGLRVSSGNVGIGTTTPGYKLHVKSPDIQLVLQTDGTGNNRGIVAFGNATGVLKGSMGLFGTDESIRIGDAADYRLVIKQGGNVGIGTTTPVGLLEVKGAYSGNSQLIINATGTSGELRFSEDGVPKGFVWYGKAGNYMAFGRGSTTNSLFVDGAGNFGIGTQNPNQKLTVNGTIYGKEVKVDLSVPGPDYVFDKDYPLTSLEDVKTYIDQHKHLPEVPSAKEMEVNGINLGEMNMILLKKVEELTLHLLSQEKRIKELEKNNK